MLSGSWLARYRGAMGILDDIKPQVRRPTPSEIALAKGGLAVAWSDGHRSLYPLKLLRERCPCAGCVDEWTGKRTVDPAAIPADIRPLEMKPVGRYAVQIGWSDGHSTGIYSWDLLLRIDAESQERKD
jgi:DUF971 family protein